MNVMRTLVCSVIQFKSPDTAKTDSGYMKVQYPLLESGCLDIEWGDDEVHIWSISLEKAASQFPVLLQKLSMDECRRAYRFRFEMDRKRFITGRGMLRTIIGHYLDIDGNHLNFCYGKHGKPYLADMSRNETIYFNLSHSDDLALYAFTRSGEIGVDIERIRDIPEMEQIVEHNFSVTEKTAFRALPESRKKEVFFHLWTRKEALLKGVGSGLYGSLDDFDVALSPGERSKFLNIEGDSKRTSNWQIQDLSPAQGFAAAYAVEASLE